MGVSGNIVYSVEHTMYGVKIKECCVLMRHHACIRYFREGTC